MGIPPDEYPVSQKGFLYAGTTSFDPQCGGAHVRCAEIRGGAGENVLSLSITVIPPKGKPSIPLQSVQFNVVNLNEPQITACIQTTDASAIADGYMCQFVFQSAARTPPKKRMPKK